MTKIIGFCGLTCSECPAYKATQKDDDNERKKVAEMWSKEYDTNLKPEDINCDGCLNGERVFNYCNTCEIRKCGKEKDVVNCAYCGDYACKKLNKFFKMAPDAKTTLDEIKKDL